MRHNARYSELVRRVVNAAEQYAQALGHGTPGAGHLLAALLHERRGSARVLLTACGLDPQRLQADLGDGQSDLLGGAEAALSGALELSAAAGSHYTGTEHLLLALVSLPACAARLTACGADINRLTAAVSDQVWNRR
jgi:ATP-dependent Clp protease ATP-binding subunit ClpA